ncbi:DMT family transporter [Candidatus Saccharibacteria bacterium]|nr:DMT family transporter [Candidatus Saccharibacteria bacterium]
MYWQLFVIVNLITASLLVPLQRLFLRKRETDPITFTVVSQLATGILLLPVAIVHGLQIPDLSRFGFAILTMFSVYAVAHYLYAHTLKQVEASIFSTLINTSTVWVVLMGYFILHETLHISDIVGTAIIMASVFMLMEHKRRKLQLERSILMGLLIGLLFGIGSSIWVYVGRHTDAISWTTLCFFATPTIFLAIKPSISKKAIEFVKGKIIYKIIILAVIWAIDNLASLSAYQHGQVSIIAPLLQTSAILTVIVAVVFLHERTRLRWKIAAAVVCFTGVVLLTS